MTLNHKLKIFTALPEGSTPKLLSEYNGVAAALPCDVHLLNLRTRAHLDDSTIHAKREALLLLHRKGFDCSFPGTTLTCSTNDGKVSHFVFLFYIIQIFTACEGNGAKHLPKMTGDRWPTIAQHRHCNKIRQIQPKFIGRVMSCKNIGQYTVEPNILKLITRPINIGRKSSNFVIIIRRIWYYHISDNSEHVSEWWIRYFVTSRLL